MISLSLRKMQTEHADPVQYFLEDVDQNRLCINNWINRSLRLHFLGTIRCVYCGRKIKKSFSQGYCYPCFRSCPETAECIIFPERCMAHEGKGRDSNWEKEYHFKPHIVYLSYTSGIKVGVTRQTQAVTRWIDQGAVEAVPICVVPYRQLAGEIEVAMKESVADKTHWQRMLKNTEQDPSFLDQKNRICNQLPTKYQEYLVHEVPMRMQYPGDYQLDKIKSLNFDKNPIISGRLVGIKGQYWIFDDSTVINIRKFSGYDISIEVEN